MKDFFQKGLKTLKPLADIAMDEISQRLTLVKENLDGLPILASLEKSTATDVKLYDEKHYFVIPYYLSEHKFALHTMRCLPKNIPEVNQLPKRRVFHFPSELHEGLLRHYMATSAKETVTNRGDEHISSLESLANNIDALDKKLTYGMLLVGGAAAIFNPLLGAGIAAKALLPSVSTLLTKYGLRPAGEKLTAHQVKKAVAEAENTVTKEFEAATTLKIINPVLANLDLALTTNGKQFDPLFDSQYAEMHIPELEHSLWREHTETAIYHTYKDIVKDPSLHKQAQLGPEDISWLNIIFELHIRAQKAQGN